MYEIVEYIRRLDRYLIHRICIAYTVKILKKNPNTACVHVIECLKECLQGMQTTETTNRVQTLLQELSIAEEKYHDKTNTDSKLLPIGLYYAVRFLHSENNDSWVVFKFDETSFQTAFASTVPIGCYTRFVETLKDV